MLFKIISPPVMVDATIKVPATILSGIMVCVTSFNSLTPSIVITEVPAPETLAPDLFK